MVTYTQTWVWYNPTDVKPLAFTSTMTSAQQTTARANFVNSLVGQNIDRTYYTDQAAWVDVGDSGSSGAPFVPDGRIDDLDVYASATGSQNDNVSPLPGEGLGFGDPNDPASLNVKTLSTFAVFAARITLDNGTVLPGSYSIAAYQFADGTVAYRLENGPIASLLSQGIRYSDINQITITGLSGFYRSVAPAGHNSAFPCYTGDSIIATDRGDIPIHELVVGDRVLGQNGSYHLVRWVGCRHISFPEDGSNDHLRPIRIAKNAMGPGAPWCDLTVSPQHRILINSTIVKKMYGEACTLVPAKALTGLVNAETVKDINGIIYYHFLCDQHQIVSVNGIWSESLYLGKEAFFALGRAQLEEIKEVFPELFIAGKREPATHLSSVKKARKMIERHVKNGHHLAL